MLNDISWHRALTSQLEDLSLIKLAAAAAPLQNERFLEAIDI